MTMLRRVVPGEVNSLGDDEVEVVLATSDVARDGHILLASGADLDNFRRNPIVLWQHSPENPIGRCEEITVQGDKITGRVRFAPLGISQTADTIRGLVKSGFVTAVSVGFDPIEGEPLDPRKPRGGQRVTDWELLELSFVSVPSDTGAIVTNRSHGDHDMAEWKIGASRSLPIEDSDSWDGAAAEKSIFDYAGGDDFDATKARKGFLVYDADAPGERGSYKLPIAHVVDGELKVSKGAIRAAASRLPDTDIPDDVKKRAEAVLDHYKKEAGIGEDDGGDRAARKPMTRATRTRAVKITFGRGLYQVAQLCYAFEGLGYQVDSAKFESAIEGDNSKVPAMLAAVLADLGDALLAMTQEEIAEALAGHDVELDDEDGDEVLEAGDRAHIRAASAAPVRAFRRGYAHAKLRAGKTLSAETVRCLREARACHDEAMDMHRSAMRKHKDGMAAVDEIMDRAGVSDTENEDTQTVQTSAGTGVDEGSEGQRAAADLRRREIEFLAFSPAA